MNYLKVGVLLIIILEFKIFAEDGVKLRRFEEWIASHPTLSEIGHFGRDSDYDRDGVSNLFEGLFYLDPVGVDSFPITINDDRRLIFPRCVRTFGGRTWVEYSNNLLQWHKVPQSRQVGLGNIGMVINTEDKKSSKRFYRIGYSDLADSSVAWSFDRGEDRGKVTDDLKGLEARLRGGVEVGSGRQDAGMVFDGTGYLEIPNMGFQLDAGLVGQVSEFTIEAWVKLDSVATLNSEHDYFCLLNKGSWTKGPHLEFGVRGGAFRGLYCVIANRSGNGHAHSLVIPDRDIREVLRPQETDPAWHHVAFVRAKDGSGSLYLDGFLIGKNFEMGFPVEPDPSQAFSLDSPFNRTWIGRNYSRSGAYFRGSIDDLSVSRSEASSSTLKAKVSERGHDNLYQGDSINHEWIHVAPPPVGDDELNDGTEELPFGTIGKALDVAHADDAERNHIFVRGGVYREGLVNRVSLNRKRIEGELLVTKDGITLEGECVAGEPQAIVSGSIDSTSSEFPTWAEMNSGLHFADVKGPLGNAQAVFFDKLHLRQVGNVWMERSIGGYWSGYSPLLLNDPNNMPEGTYYSAEKLKLVVPEMPGLRIKDGDQFSMQRGNGKIVVFEFDDEHDRRVGIGHVRIEFGDSVDLYGNTVDSIGKEVVMRNIVKALNAPEASSLGLEPKLDIEHGVINCGSQIKDGEYVVLNTRNAPSIASGEFRLFVKVPNEQIFSEEKIELAYRPYLLWINANNTTVRGLCFEHSNTSAVSNLSAITLQGENIVFERNTVRWCDYIGVNISNPVENGLRRPAYCKIVQNRFNYCGNSGIGGLFTRDTVLLGNETSRNNWREYDSGWHAGGLKMLSLHHDLKVIQHTARYNRGIGIWFDTVGARHRLHAPELASPKDIGVEVSESVSEFNERDGLSYEISENGSIFDCAFRYNRVRGVYLSESSRSEVTRNLVLGNGFGGILLASKPRFLTRAFFHVPITHPLFNNLWNLHVYAGQGCAENIVFNNIIRNNALKDRMSHDDDEVALRVSGWPVFPTYTLSGSIPAHSLPKANINAFSLAPIVGSYVNRNESDYNVIWRRGEEATYGYHSSTSLEGGSFDERLLELKPLLDMQDLDRFADGKADGVRSDRKLVALVSKLASKSLDIDRNSQENDSFEFLDPGIKLNPMNEVSAVLHSDGDGDGMYDWWESFHGLNPNDESDDSKDSDNDGISNLDEFMNWMRASSAEGEPFGSGESYQRSTNPTYSGTINGTARDLDGNQIPDQWEFYYGVEDSAEEMKPRMLNCFLRGQPPGELVNDRDSDGLPDLWESANFGSMRESGEGDFDQDGFSNLQEFRSWTLPFDSSDPVDADRDGLADRWERIFGFPTDGDGGGMGPAGDADGDGFSNLVEFEQFTHPLDASSSPLQK